MLRAFSQRDFQLRGHMPETPEQSAQNAIDKQLVLCGWVVQNYKQFNPTEGRDIALCEAPLESGKCDNLLLVDWKAVGVAKQGMRNCQVEAIVRLVPL